jgi:soluble lytic murein transglycosylase-like protein
MDLSIAPSLRALPAGTAAARSAPDGRRRERRRRFTRAGVAVALALASRHPGALPADEDQARVEVATNFRLAHYDRSQLETLIEEAATLHGISAHLVRAMVQAESGFDPFAVSPVGAQGLMQLMPATARMMGVSDPFDPRQNISGGVTYLGQLLDRFGGNVALAVAGYNAGPTRVARHRGIPPYGETRGYVSRVRSLVGESTGAYFPLPKIAVRRVSMRRVPRRPGLHPRA